MAKSSANRQKLASPWLVDIFNLHLPHWLQPLPTNLTIKTYLLQRRMGPQKGQKCRKLLRKCEKLFTGGVPAEERDGDHKANLRDVSNAYEGDAGQ